MDTIYSCIEGAPFRAGSLPAWDAGSAGLFPAMTPASLRRHIRIGGMRVEVREFSHRRIVPLKATPATVMLVVALQGQARFLCGQEAVNLSSDRAMLVACGKQVSVEWQAGARGICVTMQRVHLQAVASAAFREPRRLAAINLPFSPEHAPELFQSVKWIGAQAEPGANTGWPQNEGFEIVLLSDVIRGIAGVAIPEDVLPVARSVKCAADFIQAHSGGNCSPARLAGIAGVTQATLIKSFKACLGMSIKDYVADIRLHIAHASLSSGNDNRPVSVIAQSAGFGHASGFSRLYQKRFGEAPSQTRAKAVRS